ncbi:Protein FAM216B like [Actinidia chinensis var. chinensis]|uniref:Protein FAM216B like n=1 Tax=Actinidia chinensis var. chinensis TaxID=1590841 RepID=A0A2R6RAN6_ACTCC|nr:Protein FAM216B like [Actinidia chinensis var. chinensis]
MLVEDHETTNGWPLGLGNLNIRLRVTENFEPAAATAERSSLHAPSSSFSSFLSSDLDTEIKQSTASFFQDHSVSLGRLIGIRPRDRGVVYFPNTTSVEQHESILESRSCSDVPGAQQEEMSQGICVPIFFSIIVKMTRSKSSSSR